MFKAKEVAAMLNVSKRHVYSLRERGELVGYWFGDTLRFDPADVEAYRALCRSTTTKAASAGAFKSVLHAMHGGRHVHLPRESCA